MFNSQVSRGSAQAEANRAAAAVGARVEHVYSVAIRGFAASMAPQAVERIKGQQPQHRLLRAGQVVTVVPVQAQGGGVSGTAVQPAQETPWGTARSRSFIRDTSPADQNGHDTHVAGTIAARDNSIGVIGVAPGAPVVAVRVLDRRGSGSNSGVIAGVDYVAANGRAGDVANMSLGGGVSTAHDPAVVNAAAKGVRFALAAGNESDSANNHSPGRANGTNVFTVSAFAVGDKWASFSNYGNPPVDFAEPGVSIKSTWLSGGYNTISGTSMATSHLAGLLLAGTPRAGGNVAGDPDGNPDVIGVK